MRFPALSAGANPGFPPLCSCASLRAGALAVLLPAPCSLVAGCAGSYAGAHHGVVRGCICAVSGGGASARRPARSSRVAPAPTLVRTTVWCEAAPLQSQAAVLLPLALLALRGLRRLLRWCASRCGARLHLCSLRRRCFCPLPCSLVAGCAGSYAGAHHGVVRGCTCAVSGGGASAPRPARSSRAAPAPTLAPDVAFICTTAVALWPLPGYLVVGWAGARPAGFLGTASGRCRACSSRAAPVLWRWRGALAFAPAHTVV